MARGARGVVLSVRSDVTMPCRRRAWVTGCAATGRAGACGARGAKVKRYLVRRSRRSFTGHTPYST